MEFIIKLKKTFLYNFKFMQVVEIYKSVSEQMNYYEQLKLTNWTNKAKLLAIRQMDSNILVCTRTNYDILGMSNLYETKFKNYSFMQKLI